MAQPTTSNTAAIGMRPTPSDHAWKLKNANAATVITAIPITSLIRPNSATPPTYSISVSGVTIRFSRLRVQVSSSNPVLSAICDW